MSVLRLSRISLTVADLALAEGFYRDALGFRRVGETACDDPAWLRTIGAAGSAARAVTMRLGRQTLELVAFDAPGAPYPAESSSRDAWFQHVAIVVGDMATAFSRVQGSPAQAITRSGPQRLPPNTGTVTAWKFRDPDGHPLELIEFPAGVGDPVWQGGAVGSDVFLGIDHSAIVVRDAARSIRFYTGLLGFSEAGRSVNSGAEQERLDDLPGNVVDVVALQPRSASTPHVELLGYRVPPVRETSIGETSTGEMPIGEAPIGGMPPRRVSDAGGSNDAAAATGPQRRSAEPATEGHAAVGGSNHDGTGIGSDRDIAATRLIFQVDDLPALVSAMRGGADGSLVSEGVRLRDGSFAAMLRDPDGHRLVLVQSP